MNPTAWGMNRAASAALLLLLGACTNLTAVSTFATLGSNATSNTTAIDSHLPAAQERARMASPERIVERKQQAIQAADQVKVADLGMKTLSLYFAVLAQLSSDKTIDVKSSAASIAGSLKSLGVIEPTISAPATSLITLLLTVPLDVWRQEASAKLIDGANEYVLKLGVALKDFAENTANVYDLDISQANVYYRDLATRSTDPAIRVMLDEWRVQHIMTYAKARDQAKVLAQALTQIVQGQSDLYDKRTELTGAELRRLLARYQDDIFSAAKLF